MSFGPHLLLDFYCNSEKLCAEEYWKDLLKQLVKRVGMTKLTNPIVTRTDCSNVKWAEPNVTGLSGFIVLAESHVSFHTFAEAGYVFLDIFSCKEFDTSAVIRFLHNELDITQIDIQLRERGKNFQ